MGKHISEDGLWVEEKGGLLFRRADFPPETIKAIKEQVKMACQTHREEINFSAKVNTGKGKCSVNISMAGTMAMIRRREAA
ncbi:MAG: hypothetical protein CEO40_271 [Parcubacteria group bacterium LiPW_72]|nr:MAG: hypothetical protein CEO40_271 [Parcubacteria group bacterium LiPW_72]